MPGLVVEGELMKQASLSGKHWQKRYFCLVENALTYYLNKDDSEPRGQMILTEKTLTKMNPNLSNGFFVTTGGQTFSLCAKNASNKLKWIEYLISASEKIPKMPVEMDNQISTFSKRSLSPQKLKKITFKASGTIFCVDERYEFIKTLGTGAYGVVVAVHDHQTGKKCAIKKVTDVFDDLVDAKRILREIRFLRHYNHGGIISLLDIIPPESPSKLEDIYLVTDLMETDLHAVIYSKQPLSDDHFKYFLYQILCAVKYIHSSGSIHRDMKPSNILLNKNCDLKICDFGLACSRFDANIGHELTEYVVTRWYRAPELLLSCNHYSKAIDTWAIGCIAAEMLLRKPLFAGDDQIHQLKLIFNVLGTPSSEDCIFVTNHRAKRFLHSLSLKDPKSWADLFPGANSLLVDLIDQLLKFNPHKRISVDDALEHPYFESIYSQDDLIECSSPIRFEFEDHELTKKELQAYMFHECCDFHPELKPFLPTESSSTNQVLEPPINPIYQSRDEKRFSSRECSMFQSKYQAKDEALIQTTRSFNSTASMQPIMRCASQATMQTPNKSVQRKPWH